MANEKTVTLSLAQMILFRRLAEIYYDPKMHEKKEKPQKPA
jgi:hypothetical protein